MRAQARTTRSTGTCGNSAALQAKKGKKGYAYFFTRVPLRNGQPQPNGASHTAEISYAFNNRANGPLEWNDVDKKLADQMSSYWVELHHQGRSERLRPAGVAAVCKDLSKDKVIVLGDTVQVEATVPAEKLAFFNAR